ncbi:J domain-containing protein [Deltaproteobacteria bacterium]|nr:J domain-containing protein [Deltaproteobacteria bacterium]
MENYYKLFEVPNDADISTLRSAFRKKAKSCHPDLFQHVSPEERKNLQKKFVRLSQAYETLADPKKRQLFDLSLKKSSVKSEQQNVKEYRSTSNSSSRRNNFKQNSAFSRSNYKSTSDESEDTLEDLIKDVEEILGQFGLNFKDPLEMLVDWAREVYQELTGAFNEQEEYNKDHAGLKNKSQNNKHKHNDPLQIIEEELQCLKAKRFKSDLGKRESKHYKSSDDEIEQELRSIKNKYKL